MTEIVHTDNGAAPGGLTPVSDPTGGRLVAWARAASAANQLAKALVGTSFAPAAFRGNVGDATAAVLMGDELGLSPLAALRSIYVVHGSPSMYARTMVALAQSHGHEVWTELDTSAKVVVCGRRKGSDHVERSEWTVDRARKAGYTGNKKYDSNPQEMLYAKAASVVARKIAADVLAGVPYSVEDIELDDPSAGTVTVQREPRTVQRKQAAQPAAPGDDAEPTLITPPQMRKLQALYGEAGVTDRDARLAHTSGVVGRDVASSSQLSKEEAARLIDHLERDLQPADEEPPLWPEEPS